MLSYPELLKMEEVSYYTGDVWIGLDSLSRFLYIVGEERHRVRDNRPRVR